MFKKIKSRKKNKYDFESFIVIGYPLFLSYNFCMKPYFLQQIKRILTYINNKIRKNLGLAPKKPISLVIGITNHCNLKCLFCFHSSTMNYSKLRTKGVMEFSLFEKMINDIKGHVYHVELGLFGEPFLHPRFCDFVRLLKINSISTSLFTNGILIKREDTECLVDERVSSITFSLDGETDEAYSKLRGNEKIHIIYNNILELEKLKKKKKSSLPRIFIRSIQSMPNIKMLRDKLEKRFSSISYDQLIIAPMDNWGGGLGSSNQFKFSQKTGDCDFPWMLMSIDWDGAVIGCCEDYLLQNVLGNAKEVNILEIWNNQKITKLRNSLRTCEIENIRQNTKCENCSILKRSSHPLYFKKQLIKSMLLEVSGSLFHD